MPRLFDYVVIIILLIATADYSRAGTGLISTSYVTLLTDYVPNLALPQCLYSDATAASTQAMCMCYEITGNTNSTIAQSQTITIATDFDGGGQSWSSWHRTCNVGGTHIYGLTTSTGCNDTTGAKRMGNHSPLTGVCVTGDNLSIDINELFPNGTELEDGQIIVEEEEVEDVIANTAAIADMVNMTSQQISNLIFTCSIAISMFLGFKTGLTR